MTRASPARKRRRHPNVVDLESHRRSPSLASMRPLIGYYTRADQKRDEPDVDPPHTGPCPACGAPIAIEEVRTISVAWSGERRTLSLFYRMHRSCQDGLSEEAQMALDYTVLKIGDEIARELATS